MDIGDEKVDIGDEKVDIEGTKVDIGAKKWTLKGYFPKKKAIFL